MKKDKKGFGKRMLLEGLGEIALTLGCLVLGAAIISLFGGDVNFSETDPDLLILIGVVASFSIFAIIYYVVQWIKKKSGSNKDEKDNDE